MSGKRVAAAAVVVGTAVSALLALSTMAAIGSPAATGVQPCMSSGPVAGLADAQAQNARVIVATAAARGGHGAALIAVMTALAESGLRVLANPNDPAGAAYPHQGVGHDHDSLGLFQQRPSWGTAAQRMDPIASTNLFLDALLTVPDWSTMQPWYAAQLVQRSAFDGRPSTANGGSSIVGENYRRQLARATSIVAAIETDSATLDCGAETLTLPPAGPGRHGLPEGYTIPPGTSPAAQTAVMFALAQLGKPYIWGGVGPQGFDCSGLIQQAWARAGVQIPRVSSAQAHAGTPTTAARLLPGDLVLTPGSDGTLAWPGHVGMYIGDGLVVEAPKTGDVVKVVTYRGFVSAGLSGLRHIA